MQELIDKEILKDLFDTLEVLRQKFIEAKLLPTQYCSYLIGESASVANGMGVTRKDFIAACGEVYDLNLEE